MNHLGKKFSGLACSKVVHSQSLVHHIRLDKTTMWHKVTTIHLHLSSGITTLRKEMDRIFMDNNNRCILDQTTILSTILLLGMLLGAMFPNKRCSNRNNNTINTIPTHHLKIMARLVKELYLETTLDQLQAKAQLNFTTLLGAVRIYNCSDNSQARIDFSKIFINR